MNAARGRRDGGGGVLSAAAAAWKLLPCLATAAANPVPNKSLYSVVASSPVSTHGPTIVLLEPCPGRRRDTPHPVSGDVLVFAEKTTVSTTGSSAAARPPTPVAGNTPARRFLRWITRLRRPSIVKSGQRQELTFSSTISS